MSRLAALACVPVVAMTGGSALAQGAPQWSEVWTYPVVDWMPTSASLGEGATQAFSARGGEQARSRLFSSFDSDPPAPVWSSPAPSGLSLRNVVDSAKTTDVHAYLRVARASDYAPDRAIVQTFTSSSPIPVWTYEFPFDLPDIFNSGLQVSSDGQTIVAWVYRSLSIGTTFAVFRSNSPQPIHFETVQLYSIPRAVELSSDGSKLFLSAHARTMVLDLESWATLHYGESTTVHAYGGASSRDGSVVAYTNVLGQVHVMRRVGGTYEHWFTHQSPEGSGARCDQVALSADGAWLACGFDIEPQFVDVRLQVLALEPGGHSLVLDEVVHGSGGLNNVVQELALSADGRVFAAGLWGDEAGLADEIHVYRRSGAQWSSLLSEPLRGSVQDIDLAPDGEHLLVANKSVHANTPASGGDLRLYALGPQDLSLVGVPRKGRTVELQHRLAPGALSRTIYSGALNQPPLPFPNVGTLYLDRHDLHVFDSGVAGEDGVARTTYTIPNDPNLVGTTIYFQSVQSSPRRLSKDWIKMTILP